MSKSQPRLYEFGSFAIDTMNRLLVRDGEPVPLQPKAFDLLLLLVEHRKQVVRKEELIRRLWPDSFVDKSNLTQNIYLLRKVLGSAENGDDDYIKTIPKRGYRFVPEVKEVFGDLEESLTPESTLETANPVPGHREDPSRVIDSLAILPLINAGKDPNYEYLADGITESIINSLSQLSSLNVIARSIAFRHKGSVVDPQSIGRQLNVSAVLTGHVLQRDNRIVIQVELVDVHGGWQLWGAQFKRSFEDLLAIQEEISQEISAALRLKLTKEERKSLAKRYTDNTEAYRLYIKGRYYWNKRLTNALTDAISWFQRAVDQDPTYAMAFVGLADCYALLSLYGALTPKEAFPKSRAAAMKALDLDEGLAEAHTSLGVVKLFYEWNWTDAEACFTKAIELNPDYPDAHQRYGILLTVLRRFDEAINQLQAAQTLDPLSLITNTVAGYPYYYARRFDEAIESFRSASQMDPNFSMAHFRLGLAYEQKGMFDDALKELQASLQISGDRDVVAALGHVNALMGNKTEAFAALEELTNLSKRRYVPAYDLAILYGALGSIDEALNWLERASAERSYWLIYASVDPRLDPLRPDPRFAGILARVGL